MVLPFWPLIQRYLTAIGVMLLGMAIAWGVLWIVASAQYGSLVDTWLAAERARGHEVRFATRKLGGFPRSVTISFTDVFWDDKNGASVKTGTLALAAHPWHWRTFEVMFSGDARIVVPYPEAEDPLEVSARSGTGHVELHDDDAWHFARLGLQDAYARRPSRELFRAGSITLAAELPVAKPKSMQEIGLSFVARAREMAVLTGNKLPFGESVASADVLLKVMGPLPDPYSRDSVATWSNGGGIIEFDGFNLVWGPVDLKGRGTLGLDDDQQPEGAFSGQIGGHEEALKILTEGGWIAKRQGAMLNSALHLFTKPSRLTAGAGIEMPITVQLGGLFLGPVRLFTFPEIAWPKAQPAAP